MMGLTGHNVKYNRYLPELPVLAYVSDKKARFMSGLRSM